MKIDTGTEIMAVAPPSAWRTGGAGQERGGSGEAFAELTAKWKKETYYSSKAAKKAQHPAYREIVAMGEKALTLIMADLEKNGGQWFMALWEISGANPVPEATPARSG